MIEESELIDLKTSTLSNYLREVFFICNYDDNFTIKNISKNSIHIFGYSNEEIIQSAHTTYLHYTHPLDRDKLYQKRKKAYQGKEIFEAEYRIIKKDGTIIWIEEISQAIFSEYGNPIEIEGFFRIAASKSKREKVLQSFRAFNNVLHKISSVSIIDIFGITSFANENFYQLTSFKVDEIIGKPHHFFSSKFYSQTFFESIWQDIQSGVVWKGEFKNIDKHGRIYWVDAVITPVVHKGNKIDHYIIVENDITQKKIQEEEILKTSIALKESQRIAKLGNWSIDVASAEIVCSEQVYAILKLPLNSLLTFNSFITLVYEEDKKVIENLWNSITVGKPYDIEFRLKVDSNIIWVKSNIRIEFNEEGDIVFVHGILLDITDSKIKTLSIEAKQLELKAILENAPVIITKTSADFKNIYTNQEKVVAYGESVFQFIKTDYHESFKTKAKEAQISGKTVQIEVQAICLNGKLNWYRVFIKKFIDNKADNEFSFLIIYQNITLEKNFNDELLKATTESEEKERLRIATDLHDGVCQHLVALKLINENFINDHLHLFKQQQTIENLNNIRKLISTSLAEIRQCSHDLRPLDLYELGLFESLKSLFAINNAAKIIKFSLEINCINEPTDYIAINIYRITQEFIQNSLKHSEATEVNMRINENKDHLVFKISDNGKGFEPTTTKKTSLGLLSIMSRIKNIGGKYNLITNSGEGVQLFFSIKIKD